ncbi:PREDICTED: cyclin-dependent kinase inhibitor 5-like [Tarenaya hassleriana]|uniref:cyclin-dependent kinase inhibitor 5-like n=1 Tax=Tarenaya hassleriana TaxID=28532 RepID=UPI00053C3F79|nr:PREDICTED: cyclin-dependent kinase inhibitor 5-like [Tarenaya hassleriana]
MGRYTKKPKIAGEISVVDVSQTTTTLGFRTRAAKNLALQRLRSLYPSPATSVEADSFRYLQLRSRRLEKHSSLTETRKQPQHQQLRQRVCNRETRNPRAKPTSVKSASGTVAPAPENKGHFGNNEGIGGSDSNFDEALSGENSFDIEPRARSTRESTPCNLVSDTETVRTPGSTSRRRSPVRTHDRARDGLLGIVPSSREIEEFFECAERQEQRFFRQKYNFDILNEVPLPGRFEWVKMAP